MLCLCKIGNCRVVKFLRDKLLCIQELAQGSRLNFHVVYRVQKWKIRAEPFHQLEIHHLHRLFDLLVVVWKSNLDGRDRVDCAGMKDHGHDAKPSIFGNRIARLAHVVSREPVLDVQVDIKNVMHVVFFDNPLQLLVLPANLLQVFRIQTLLSEVDENAPAPVLVRTLRAIYILDLHADKSARDQEGHNVLWLAHNFTDRAANLLLLKNEFLLFANQALLWNSHELLKLLQLFAQLCLYFWKNALVLELMETLHYDVLWDNIFNPHHVQKHIVAQVE